MRISALEEYGLRCLLALAQAGETGRLSISEIAEKEKLSIPYTSKLLSILRKTGLVNAVRGRSGGFCISRRPEDINLLEVITALGGPLIDPKHCTKFSGQLEKCIHTENCTVQYTLAGLARLVGEFLSSTTLEDIKRGPALNGITKIESKVSILSSFLENCLNSDEQDENKKSVIIKKQ